VGAHREAAAQYARALRFGDSLSTEQRAELLERRAEACLLTDQYDEGIAALEEELECRRALGDRLKEGDALRRLSDFLWCPGRTQESESAARAAVALLEGLPPTRELGLAYAALASTHGAAARTDEAIAWGRRAIEVAEHFDDAEPAVHALITVATCEFVTGGTSDGLRQTLDRAVLAGMTTEVARAYTHFAGVTLDARDYGAAQEYVQEGLDYCSNRGLELFRLYLLADRARLELETGRWADAADSAAAVLRIDRTSTTPRIFALVVLGLVRARRGDPGHRELLEEAWRLAEPTGELPRLGPVAAARAEEAWLEGNLSRIDAATASALQLAVDRTRGPLAAELLEWRRRAGIEEEIPPSAAGPFAVELAGDWSRRPNGGPSSAVPTRRPWRL